MDTLKSFKKSKFNESLMPKLFSLIIIFTVVIIGFGCNKDSSDNGLTQEDEFALQRMLTASNDAKCYNDSLMYCSDTAYYCSDLLIHHYDSLYHHHESLYDYHHDQFTHNNNYGDHYHDNHGMNNHGNQNMHDHMNSNSGHHSQDHEFMESLQQIHMLYH